MVFSAADCREVVVRGAIGAPGSWFKDVAYAFALDLFERKRCSSNLSTHSFYRSQVFEASNTIPMNQCWYYVQTGLPRRSWCKFGVYDDIKHIFSCIFSVRISI